MNLNPTTKSMPWYHSARSISCCLTTSADPTRMKSRGSGRNMSPFAPLHLPFSPASLSKTCWPSDQHPSPCTYITLLHVKGLSSPNSSTPPFPFHLPVSPRSPTAESNGRLQAASRSRWGRRWLMHAVTSVHWIALLQTYILLCIGALKHILMAVQVCTVYNRALSILLLHNLLCQHWLRIHPVFQRLSNSFNVWLKWAMHKLRQSSRTHSSLPQL